MIIWLALVVALTTAGVRAEGELAPAADPPAGLPSWIFFAAAALGLASTVGLLWVWRQKSESEQMLKNEQTKLREAEARWRTQQQNFESKIKKLEDQTAIRAGARPAARGSHPLPRRASREATSGNSNPPATAGSEVRLPPRPPIPSPRRQKPARPPRMDRAMAARRSNFNGWKSNARN